MGSMDLARWQALTAVQQLLKLTKDKSAPYRQHVSWHLAPSLMPVAIPPSPMTAAVRAQRSKTGKTEIDHVVNADHNGEALFADANSVCPYPQASP